MSAGSPGEDGGGEPVPPIQPGPLPSEPADFLSPAPADWSAPVEWALPAPSAQPTQSAPQAEPGPLPWSFPDDSESRKSAGNGVSPADADPEPARPNAEPSTAQRGAPPAGPYGYPSAASHPPTAVRTNRVAIAALVCGLAQFFLGLFALNFLLAIPAIICGAIGMHQTRQRGQGGRGLSIAGLVLGILGIVWNVLYVVLVIALTKGTSASGS